MGDEKKEAPSYNDKLVEEIQKYLREQGYHLQPSNDAVKDAAKIIQSIRRT